MPSRDGRRPIGQPAELRKLLAELWGHEALTFFEHILRVKKSLPPAKTEPKSTENPCQLKLLAGVNIDRFIIKDYRINAGIMAAS